MSGYTTGSFDILIEAHLPDNEGLYKFLNEELEKIEGIAYTETWHILRTDKTNFEWEGENVGRRLTTRTHAVAAQAARQCLTGPGRRCLVLIDRLISPLNECGGGGGTRDERGPGADPDG